jgi:hypothetical protein
MVPVSNLLLLHNVHPNNIVVVLLHA